MNCLNCGRSNPADNAYCSKCGFRLPNAAARGTGITYKRTENTEPHGGGGQGLLAFGAVLLAGLLFVVGPLVILVSAPPAASPTAVANVSPANSLPIFVQPTATPTVPPTPTEVPSLFGSPSPLLSPSVFPESPTPIVVPTPTPTTPPATPTPTPTRGPTPTRTPTPTPTPTAEPTPRPTPANCDLATGTPQKVVVLSSQNAARSVPAGKVWCLTGVSIEPGANYGPVRLFVGNRILAEANCQPGTCNPAYPTVWTPDEIVIREGRILGDFFVCDADLATEGIQDCAGAGVPEGAFIRVGVEVFPAP